MLKTNIYFAVWQSNYKDFCFNWLFLGYHQQVGCFFAIVELSDINLVQFPGHVCCSCLSISPYISFLIDQPPIGGYKCLNWIFQVTYRSVLFYGLFLLFSIRWVVICLKTSFKMARIKMTKRSIPNPLVRQISLSLTPYLPPDQSPSPYPPLA